MSQVNPDLESLDLSSNSVGAQGVAALAEALAENAHVTAFFLASNGVNAQGAVALSKALKVNDSITELHLWNNSLGVAGSASIAHALKVNRSLQVCRFYHFATNTCCWARTQFHLFRIVRENQFNPPCVVYMSLPPLLPMPAAFRRHCTCLAMPLATLAARQLPRRSNSTRR